MKLILTCVPTRDPILSLIALLLRYMDWYNGPNQNSPHRPSQLSTISAPAIPYGSVQSLRPSRTRSPSREPRQSTMVRTGSLTNLSDEDKIEEPVAEHSRSSTPEEERSRANSIDNLEDSSESGS